MSYSEPAAPEGVELFSADPELNRHPQEMYRALRATAPVVSLDGMGHVLTTKEAAMEAFRRPDVFSSAATVDTLAMGSVRPLIPLQIDPPDHMKYRKILDPLFAPRGRWPRSRSRSRALVNDLIDGFVDRGEVDFAKEFSVPFPSQVFLTLLGLPLDGRSSLPADEGRHHPARPRHRQAARRRGDARVPARDRAVDLRLLRRRARRARGRATRRPAQPVPRRRGRRASASPARTSSTSASCSSSPASTP